LREINISRTLLRGKGFLFILNLIFLELLEILKLAEDIDVLIMQNIPLSKK
jgi:hypothetical protein